MVYRITNHSKTLQHYIILLICFFLINTSIASSQSINVYLKLKPQNDVIPLIKEFNRFLAQEQVFNRYQITPYLEHHPLHVTLYMANYQSDKIPGILKYVEKLATQTKPVPLRTSQLVVFRSGYVMLTVANNSQIQGLSNNVLNALSHLRDKKASIPAWAIQNKTQQQLFNQYGSPNVLNYYRPHFSIFSADHLSKHDSSCLYNQLQKLIPHFNQHYSVQIHTTAWAIGVGITNAQGQILHELKSSKLSLLDR